MGIIKRTQT